MNNNNEKKSRRPLRPGDMVKFVGWAVPVDPKIGCCLSWNDDEDWQEVISSDGIILKIRYGGIEYSAHRRQVTHVKCKKKYVDRNALARVWDKLLMPVYRKSDYSDIFKNFCNELKQEGFEGF